MDRGRTVLDMTEVTKHCLSAQHLGKLSTEKNVGISRLGGFGVEIRV